MTDLRLVATDPVELAVDAVVIGLYRQEGEGARALLPAPGSERIAEAFDGLPGGGLVETLYRLGATGSADEVTKLATFGAVPAPLVVAVGLGKPPAGGAPTAEALRRAAGAATRSLAGAGTVALALPTVADPAAVAPLGGEPAALRATAEGALLGTYRFDRYRTRPAPERRAPVGEVLVRTADPEEFAAEAGRCAVVTAAVRRARDWVNTAPNDLRPPQFAEEVRQAASDVGLAVEVLDEQALEREAFGGILAVGLGSAAPPRLVRIAYRPEHPAQSIALVGKGITFDSGGLSIKPAQGMWEMKSDMGGAAAVAAAMLAIAELRPAIAVTAYLPMAENMPSGSAYRPSDIVRIRNGKLVEILNTDAEGRLLLADAISWAVEDSPDHLLETSTLTGGQVISLGKRIAGVMGSPELCELVRAAGERVGEPAWPMPLPDDVRSTLDSDIADVLQVSAGMERAGHMLQGGLFLREFVPEDASWAHLDIAGPAFNSGSPTGYLTKGGTGFPVRTLIEFVESLAR